MIHQLNWVERKFNFDFPTTMFPVILGRLLGAVPRIEAIIHSFPPDLLGKKPEGRWSVKEQIGHLADLEELHLGRIEDFRNNKPVLRAADMGNEKTVKANHNERAIEDLMSDLKKVRKHFIEELRKIDEEELSKTALHPRLNKQMRLVDMLYFVAEHDDHHIAKMLALTGTNDGA